MRTKKIGLCFFLFHGGHRLLFSGQTSGQALCEWELISESKPIPSLEKSFLMYNSLGSEVRESIFFLEVSYHHHKPEVGLSWFSFSQPLWKHLWLQGATSCKVSQARIPKAIGKKFEKRLKCASLWETGPGGWSWFTTIAHTSAPSVYVIPLILPFLYFCSC